MPDASTPTRIVLAEDNSTSGIEQPLDPEQQITQWLKRLVFAREISGLAPVADDPKACCFEF